MNACFIEHSLSVEAFTTSLQAILTSFSDILGEVTMYFGITPILPFRSPAKFYMGIFP